jgi:hypothetical protein
MFIAVCVSSARMMWIVFIGCVASSLLLLVLPTEHALWAGSALLGALMAPTFPTLYTLAGSFMPVSGRVATVFVIGASAGVIHPLHRAAAARHIPLTHLQELVFPTMAGYLMDSSGPQSFPLLIFCCTLVNLCLFKPVCLSHP